MLYQNVLKFIKLDWMNCFFQLWCSPCGSSKICFHEKLYFGIVLITICVFSQYLLYVDSIWYIFDHVSYFVTIFAPSDLIWLSVGLGFYCTTIPTINDWNIYGRVEVLEAFVP